MKKIVGLDVGTNSVGGALINLPWNFDDYGKEGSIEWLGSRIIPTDGDYLKKFTEGQTAGLQTKASERRSKRGARRLKHRYKLRRSRLIKVFKELKWIPEELPLDEPREFKKNLRTEETHGFSISNYLPFSEETIREFETELGIEGKKSPKRGGRKGGKSIAPEDWIIYYLRKKALKSEISLSELARIIYMMNQRRGFKSSRKDLKETIVLPYNVFLAQKDKQEYGEGIETQFATITKIESVTYKEDKRDKKGNVAHVYTVKAEDPRMATWEETRRQKPDWEGKQFTFLVTQKVDKRGKFTQNKPQSPKEDDWALSTIALDEKINEHPTPGAYFFDELKSAYLNNRHFKVRQYPVYRWRYKQELEAIWNTQCRLNRQLAELNTDGKLLARLAELLYPTQFQRSGGKVAQFQNADLLHIISNDIIYYQRDRKSQKNLKSECRYEKRKGTDGEVYGLKCIPRSSPLFQEFRIWQDIHNIRVLEREVINGNKTILDVDVTATCLDNDLKVRLFELFQSKESVGERDILWVIAKHKPHLDIRLDLDKKNNIHSHRITAFANRKELKGNELLHRYRKLFKSAGVSYEDILSDSEKLFKLWHIDYSITSTDEEKSKKGIATALDRFFPELPNNAIELFIGLSELKKEYGACSAMAIKKLLPLMKCGKYWNVEAINADVRQRIDKFCDGEFDENIDDEVRTRVRRWASENRPLAEPADFNGLPTWLACYVAYGQHSERKQMDIKTPEQFTTYIQKELPNNSLRQPIVEKVVRETMFLVRDIWKKYGDIHEIHIELGRALKKNSAEREKLAETHKSNFEEKQQIRKLLYELINDGFDQYIDEDCSNPMERKTTIEYNAKFDVKPNPESPVDIDKFRIWKNLSKLSDTEWEKKVKDEKIPTALQIKKYALWLSQNCRSPYTGRIIPLSKLFDKAQYEIEHIIPRSKFASNSFNNLVIAEAAINPIPYKGNMLARNFITQFGGKSHTINNQSYYILSESEYEQYCKDTFKHQRGKLKNLLATEPPEGFVERQLNDTRYIGRKLSELLAPITRNAEGEQNPTGIVFTIGSITSELKNNWGLNSVWKDMVRPRFERLEKITGAQYIIPDTENPNKYHFNFKNNPKLEIKRIDHRHHALDALIIAATTREHIRYLNTLSAADTDEDFKDYRRTLVKGKIREFRVPWGNFTRDAKEKLEEVIVTFKSANSIVSKPTNTYIKGYNEKNKPIYHKQKKNGKWLAVRRSMFKEPQGIIHVKEVYEEKNLLRAIEIQIHRMLVQNTGEMRIAPYVYDQEARMIIRNLIDRAGVSLQEKDTLLLHIKNHLKKHPLVNLQGEPYQTIKIASFNEYAAKRVKLDNTFDHKKINKIPYAKDGKSVLGNLLHEHLDSVEFEGKPELAFSGEGLDILAKRAGRPISKVTIIEKKDESSRFGNQYVETDANSHFVMYEDVTTKVRDGFTSVPIHKAIERITNPNYRSVADDKEGYNTIVLTPGTLVYVPSKLEQVNIANGIPIAQAINWADQKHISKNIYRMTDTTQGKCLFVPHRVSSPIDLESIELGSQNKSARAWDGNVMYVANSKGKFSRVDSGTMIKEVCIKVNVDRLGNISHTWH